MTGMGEDGAEGLGELKAAGAFTMAQSEETCVVAGMPKSAIDRGYVDKVAPLGALARILCKRCAPDAQQAKDDSGAVAQRTPPHEILILRRSKNMSTFAPLTRKDDQRPVRYLVVDDSVFARKNLARMIDAFGGEVAGEAGDGVAAIAEYNRIKPDLVLMDITMPQMEGIEAVEQIMRQHPEARIVMVSSVGYQDNILAALQTRRPPFRAEARQAGSALRNLAVRSQRPGLRRGRRDRRCKSMKMELLQPFINSADAVLAQTLRCATTVGDVTMEEECYRRKGLAALVLIRGELEGRIILDIEPRTAAKAASFLAGEEVAESADLVRETVCELANMLIGNAVTSLNDQGFHFKVAPPEIHTAEEGLNTTADTDALVMSFETPYGVAYLNLAVRKNTRRRSESRATAHLPV